MFFSAPRPQQTVPVFHFGNDVSLRPTERLSAESTRTVVALGSVAVDSRHGSNSRNLGSPKLLSAAASDRCSSVPLATGIHECWNRSLEYPP